MLRMHQGPVKAQLWLLRATTWLQVGAAASCDAQRSAALAPRAASLVFSNRGSCLGVQSAVCRRRGQGRRLGNLAGDVGDSLSAKSAELQAELHHGAAAELQSPSSTDNEEAALPPPETQLDPGLYIVGTPIGAYPASHLVIIAAGHESLRIMYGTRATTGHAHEMEGSHRTTLLLSLQWFPSTWTAQ